ncbi:MAG: hypothetical protein H7061_04370 [Bdellovibrionaceae bacterium]|nr:hypothetical protein [Bdellovibrio sp.]
MKNIFMVAITILGFQVQASESYPLEKLDKTQSCVNSAQKMAAEKSLAFLENFKWWKIKNIVQSLHPGYQAWHASRVYWASVTPVEKIPSLPYKNGQVSHDGVIAELAMVAYTNDVPKYTIDLKRVECVADDIVIITTIFNGVNVVRNAQGKALYSAGVVDVPTRFTITIKDGLIYRDIIDLPDATTVELLARIGNLIKAGVPNVVPGTIPDQTYQQIYQNFLDQAGE